MSFSSFASAKGRRRSKLITDEDVVQYALRVAYLSYLMQPKPVLAPGSEASSDSRESKDYSSRIAGAVSNSILSIGEIIKDAGGSTPKSVKFPEKLLKVLEAKLQAIAMKKEPSYSDQRIRRTVAIFYGQFTQDTFRRQMKENRKIEELILMFATTCTTTVRKDPELQGDAWKVELNNQIGLFIRMLRECLKTISHVSPELTARLEMYTAKLAPSSGGSDSGYDSPGPSSAGSRNGDFSPAISNNIYDMKLVRIVAQLVGISDHDLQNEVNKLKLICTEKSALIDLKLCLKNINAGEAFPAHPEDFENDAAWQQYRTTELAQLSQLMLIMVQFNPELAKSAPSEALPHLPSGRPESMYGSYASYDSPSRNPSNSSRYSLAVPSAMGGGPMPPTPSLDEEEFDVGQGFTYIPPHPRKYYKRLLELCVQADLEIMASLPPDQEVSLGILSAKHVELINECLVRWRIPHSYRAACFLDVVKYKYEREEVPMECIPEAMQLVDKAIHEHPLEKWMKQDHDYLATIFSSLHDIFIGAMYHSFDVFPQLKRKDIGKFLEIIERIRDSHMLERLGIDPSATVAPLSDRAQQLSTLFYQEKKHQFVDNAGVNRALPLLFLTDEIEKAAKLLDTRFPEPILGKVDLVTIFMECTVPLFLDDLDANKKRIFEGSKNLPHPDVPIEDIFALFRRSKTIVETYQEVCPSAPLHFNITEFFEPYVRQWLQLTDGRVHAWVTEAIKHDKFETEEGENHTSSSIVDLFDSLRSPIQFLLDLGWPEEYQNARFFTQLSKTVATAVELYCERIEELFNEEMFPRPPDGTVVVKPSILQKAKQTIQLGEKRVEGFNITASSCIKLNNVEAARRLLDRMYQQMNADAVADVLKHVPPVPDKNPAANPRFLFTIKIVLAEGLVALDSSPSSSLDTFVTLSDEHGYRHAKTRTIYETMEPRWEQTFDISVEKPLWLMASVRDRALVGKHDTVGRAYICLDPRRYGDFLAHDMYLDLDTQGRLLLRISMEGEQDDIQFYFGRAFRSLKRSEGDMVRIFIDKMSPFIKQSLSRSVLRSLAKSGTISALDYNKAVEGVAAFYRQAIGTASNEVQIPLPQSEKPRLKEGDLTDVEIEHAIGPLFSYLEINLQVFNTYLEDSTKSMVMLRVWKEILVTIEGLLIPPLSAVESDMKPLSDKEVDIVFKWLQFLRDFFYAGGEGPVPIEELQNQKYHDVISIRLYYDWTTDNLMEECVRMMQQSLKASHTLRKKAKTVLASKNLGTIKDRKREKREKKGVGNGETIMRILRMRPHSSDFLSQQLSIIASIQNQNEQRAQSQPQVARPTSRMLGSRNSQIPLVPPLPPLRSPG